MATERKFQVVGEDYVAGPDGNDSGGPGGIDGGGDGPHDGDMEPRVRELENTVTDIRERLARIETTLGHVATSHAVEKMSGELKLLIEGQATRSESIRSDLIKWFVATALVLGSLAFTAAKFIH